MEQTKKWLDKNRIAYTVSADGLIYVDGDITIPEKQDFVFEGLAEVSGHVYVSKGATFTAPVLAKSGSVDVREGATFTAPVLAEVSGYVDVSKGATFTAPVLAKSGSVYVSTGATFTAPVLAKSGHVDVSKGATFTAPELTDADQIIFDGEMCGHKLRNFDGMGAIVLSEKQKDGVTITYCRKSKMVKGKFTGEKFYVASMGDKHAHGITIALATQELAFKTGNRDLSQFKDIKLDTVKTPDEWGFVYRMVTGACQYGTQQFMKSQKLKKKYTLSEIIKLTAGAYGGSQFATFMKGAA